jgi:small subunit ribosomal protein S8
VPDLFPQNESRGRDPRREEGKLVSAGCLEKQAKGPLRKFRHMMTDPIADMLTRVRNAIQIDRPFVEIPSSTLKIAIAEALAREGFIWDFELIENKPQNILRINLKYGPGGEAVIQRIERTSMPGRRVYSKVKDMSDVLQGMGISILSTSKGVLSNREAKKQGVGGEVLCTLW